MTALNTPTNEQDVLLPFVAAKIIIIIFFFFGVLDNYDVYPHIFWHALIVLYSSLWQIMTASC